MLTTTMKVHPTQVYTKASDFFKVCSSFLCERESENSLILGVGGTLGTAASPYEQFYLASHGDQKVEGAFMMTPPHKLIVSSPASEKSMLAIIENILATKRALPGVNGPADISDRFAKLWEKMTSNDYELAMKLYCYQLSKISEIPHSSGQIREANIGDLALLTFWAQEFNRDVNVNLHEDEARLRQKIKTGIEQEGFYIWEDKRPVSMLRASGTTPTGVRISFVYTPPEYRGLGYASSLVADASKIKLSKGKIFCFLFTDATNSISNKIYQRIGYEKVCKFHEHAFKEKEKGDSFSF